MTKCTCEYAVNLRVLHSTEKNVYVNLLLKLDNQVVLINIICLWPENEWFTIESFNLDCGIPNEDTECKYLPTIATYEQEVEFTSGFELATRVNFKPGHHPQNKKTGETASFTWLKTECQYKLAVTFRVDYYISHIDDNTDIADGELFTETHIQTVKKVPKP